jgi:ABC-type transport system substrate-binding protein
VLADNSEAIERLGAGEFDLMLYLSPDFLDQLSGNPRITLLRFGGLNTMFLGMQLDRPALRDRRLREAVVRAVNRDRLANVLGRGAMIVAKGPLPPGCAGFDPGLGQPAYDTERARSLVKAASPDAAPQLRLLYFDPLELWAEIAHAVRSDLAKIGVNADLVRVPSWKEFHV